MPADPPANVVALDEAATLLGLPEDTVLALVDRGFLVPTGGGSTGPTFPLSDVEAFLARNADQGAPSASPGAALPWDDEAALGPQELLDALDGRTAEMARRLFRIYAGAFPEAHDWDPGRRAAFVDEAQARFEAILAVTGGGGEHDTDLIRDLQQIGANAVRTGTPLPHLLMILRFSRDLVVQTAVEVSGGRVNAALALSLLLTRILPAMDRLTDAVARGYWAAALKREEESLAHYSHVVEHASDGVYEADLDGRVTFANPAFARLVGRPRGQVEGAELTEVLRPAEEGISAASLLDDRGGVNRHTLAVRLPDGGRRLLSIETIARRMHGEVVGFQGVVRDETAGDQLMASLVGALSSGPLTVRVEAERTGGEVVIRLVSHRPTLAATAVEPVRGLLETLGGRVWYEHGGESGGRICLAVSTHQPAR